MSNNLFTRRDFLRLSGITIMGLHLAPARLTASPPALQGRALIAAPVHAGPHLSTSIRAHLWPDSITQISGQHGDWYQVDRGYVQRQHLQPLEPLPAHATTLEPPFWAQVSGTVAVVRQWCAAEAPLIARIGHGGTARVVDFLAPGWYGLRDTHGTWLGWTPAAPWQPVTTMPEAPPINRLVLDRATYTLTAYQDDREILLTPTATGGSLPVGRYQITSRHVSGTAHADTTTHLGAPWQLEIEALGQLSGVYWHNRFGDNVPGPAVQIVPCIARWLYGYNQTLEIT